MDCNICGSPMRAGAISGVCRRTKECRSKARYLYPINKNWIKSHPEYAVFHNIKARAKRYDIPFELELNDIPPVPEYCPVLGIKLERNIGGKAGTKNSPSLDRIDPSKGYVRGNIQWMSKLANMMKQDASPDQLKAFSEWVRNTFD